MLCNFENSEASYNLAHKECTVFVKLAKLCNLVVSRAENIVSL